jgi:hypothetical protein
MLRSHVPAALRACAKHDVFARKMPQAAGRRSPAASVLDEAIDRVHERPGAVGAPAANRG